MADIVYTIDYDENGLHTSQHLEKIGSPDRIRFVTTTKEYKVALERDPKKKSPFEGVKDPYPVPLATAKKKWIKVVHPGSGFHYICGYLEGNKFEKWPTQQGKRVAGG